MSRFTASPDLDDDARRVLELAERVDNILIQSGSRQEILTAIGVVLRIQFDDPEEFEDAVDEIRSVDIVQRKPTPRGTLH